MRYSRHLFTPYEIRRDSLGPYGSVKESSHYLEIVHLWWLVGVLLWWLVGVVPHGDAREDVVLHRPQDEVEPQRVEHHPHLHFTKSQTFNLEKKIII
jgi:hypothetical protein